MNALTKEQVKELNERIMALYLQGKAIKVEIEGEEHYIADITEDGTSATYYDGSLWEGGLDEMMFMDESPDDGIAFDDLTQEEFEQFEKDLYDEKNSVDIVLVITGATNQDSADIDWNITNDDTLVGYICERAHLDLEEDEFIAVCAYDAETERYKVIGYHSDILKRIEQRQKDVKEIDLVVQYPHNTKVYASFGIEVTFTDRKDVSNRSYDAFKKMIINFVKQLNNRGLKSELIDDLTIDIQFEEEEK